MSFQSGDTVIWDGPNSFNPDYWDNLSEVDRVKYYSRVGYGSISPVLFTFVCHHKPQHGHCMLVNMQNQKIETMCHTSEFRLATEDEA